MDSLKLQAKVVFQCPTLLLQNGVTARSKVKGYQHLKKGVLILVESFASRLLDVKCTLSGD